MPFENSVPSQIIWVSPDGNDDNSGSNDAPLQSIQFAIDRATPGTAILLLPGSYTGNFEFEKIQGTPEKPIWLAAAEGPGSVTITAGTNTESVITIRGEDNIVIRDLVLVGGFDGIEISQSGTNFTDLVNNIVVQGNRIAGAANDGIKVGQANNALVIDNVVDGAGDQGIDFLGVTNSVLDGNEIMNVTGSSGLFVKGGSSDVLVVNNYVHDVTGDGILVGGWSNADAFLPGTGYEARNVTVTGNVVEDAAKRPLTVRGAENVDIHGNFFGTMVTNESVVLIGAGSPELSPPPPSSNVAIHDNVFDRAYNFSHIEPGSTNISFFDNDLNGVVEGDMRPFPPDPSPESFADTLPQSLLDAPTWATSARSTASFSAGSGNQTLTGTAGNDFLSGGSGDDTTIGGDGDDLHSIGSSRDRAVEQPGEGVDTVIAYVASYELPANIENLTAAYAGGGNYRGNAQDNIITGGIGNDTLTGRSGNDLFVASANGGADAIADFDPASGDRIDMRNMAEFRSFDDVLARTVQNGANTLISFAGASSLTLNGVSLASLTADDFLFQPVAEEVNTPPTGIALSGNSVAEDAFPGAAIGTLAAFDADTQDAATFALVDNPGGLFAIDGNQLILAGFADYETAQSHVVTVRATDSAGNTFDQALTIDVTNAAPASPVDADASPSFVAEGAATGTLAGITALALDVNGGAVAYALLDDAGGRFAIDPTTGVVTVADGALIDYEQAPGHQIVVAALDGSGGVSTATFLITVANIDGVTIVGTAGADIIDQTHAPAGQPFPTVDNDVISAGAGNDFIAALSGDDTIIGGAGADAMDGGAGSDIASYANAKAGVALSLAAGVGTTGDAKGDIFWNIENVIGSAYADTIEGDGGDNGMAGGDGIDTLSYESADAGIWINLALTGGQDTVGAGIDTISGFEYVLGSAFDDHIAGNKVANVLKGFGGDDCLNGGEGNDLLVGGIGSDTLTGGSGADTFIFGSPTEGVDTITDFNAGADRLRVAAATFGGGLAAGGAVELITTSDLASATGPDGRGYFLFDNSDPAAGALYWDASGGAADDAVVLAQLTGVTSLAASDFLIV